MQRASNEPLNAPLPPRDSAIGILETTGWTPAMVALDAMEKAASIAVWHAELNDFLGTCIKFIGSVEAVDTALGVGLKLASLMGGHPRGTSLSRPSRHAIAGIDSRIEFNPLIEQHVVHAPIWANRSPRTTLMANASESALGFLETQGFTAVIEAIDTACKAASVEVIGKEKLGGGYVTVVIRGDVAAVRAAIDAARPKVEGLGTLIAAHVIPRPSPGVLGLLPSAAAATS